METFVVCQVRFGGRRPVHRRIARHAYCEVSLGCKVVIKLLLPDQLREMQTLETAVEMMPDFDSAARVVVARLAAILDTPVALVERRGSTWDFVCDSGGVPATAVDAITRRLEDTSPPDGEPTIRTVDTDTTWTCLSLRLSNRRVLWLLCADDWTLSTRMLVQMASRLAAGITTASRRGRVAGRSGRLLHILARRLARTDDFEYVCQSIVDAAADAVNAQKVSLALPDETDKALAIVATRGYPAVLVKHLHFRPGAGIIGNVFRTRRALWVGDVTQTAATIPVRRRYRTPSFLAVPLVASGRVLGVLCASDREDGRPFTRRDLATLRTLSGVVCLALDRARAMALAAQRDRDASIDPVTGLFNRRHFVARLEEEIERGRRDATPLTMVMIDIDNFKAINDRLGHPTGDALLRAVGDLLRRSVRVFDVCARYGGDEFAILMLGGGEDHDRIAERIRGELQGQRLGIPWTDDLTMTASLGVATMTAQTADELIERADQALYTAKRSGKNRVSRSSDEL